MEYEFLGLTEGICFCEHRDHGGVRELLVTIGEIEEDSSKTTGKTTGKTPDKILKALREDSNLSIPMLAMQIEKSERAIERAIKKLREEGKLERVGSARGGSWRVL